MLDAVRQFFQRIRNAAELSPVELDILESLAIIAMLVVVRWIVLYVVARQTTDARARYHWRKAVTYIAVAVGLFLVGGVWLAELSSLATFLGLATAGLAVALKDPVQNVAGWLFLIWRRPFVVGDRIEIGGRAGDVIDMRLFQFTLLEIGNWVEADQSTGRLVHVPNGRVFTEPVSNYTRGFPYIWNELRVMVTFESDWAAAKEILLGIATRHGAQLTKEAEQQVLAASRHFMIFYSTLAPTVYTSVAENGVRLTIRYLCEARRRRGTAQEIWEEVLRELGKREDIGFAYPTQRFYDNVREGKPGARAEAEPPV
jgi:small-conductance mechanosensitive channel